MKEAKVYVDELPEDCKDCPCCSCELKPEFIKFGDIMYCNLLKQKFKYKEERKKLKDCPLIDIKTRDEEKDKQIKKLEQKVQELQELDNKRAFKLYYVLYNELEKQCPENVASRIDFMTSENYADICELYKTAKNLKQHDRELVKEVCEKIYNDLKPHYGEEVGAVVIERVLSNLQKEFEK